MSQRTAFLLCLSLLSIARVASAQEAPVTTPPPVVEQQQATTTSTTPNVASTAVAAATTPATETDHDRVIGHVGLRYFGLIGGGGTTMNPVLGAPTVGVRYWVSQMLGIEGGIGFILSSAQLGGTSFRMAVAGGVPLNLARVQHLAIHIIPNVAFAFATGEGNVLIRAGADAAAELHFGFIGVPQMSLQARFGLMIDLSAGNNTTFLFGTTAASGANVWDVIAGSVSATYYFGR